ncbi:acid phosphatase/Vanadium-dependent haloperoxidase [Pelomyxa schiedti]|nr:acid phosphatase/Vanadium-dependent haloperoxidase [Pelomyxa schiedti]
MSKQRSDHDSGDPANRGVMDTIGVASPSSSAANDEISILMPPEESTPLSTTSPSPSPSVSGDPECSFWGAVALSHKHRKMLIKLERDWFVTSYISDYILTAVIFIIGGIIEKAVSPYNMEIPGGADNYNLQYTYMKESVPTWLLCILAFVVPTLAVICINLALYALRCRRSGYTAFAHDTHNFILGIVEFFALAILFASIGKVVAGRYRPNYFNMPDDVRESQGRKSFPSGHSTIAFGGFTFLSLYLAGKLKAFVDTSGQLWKLILVLLPEIPALLIALSRTRDYYHDFSDIVAGAGLGIAIAFVCYNSLYYPLNHPNCNEPKRRTPIVSLPLRR